MLSVESQINIFKSTLFVFFCPMNYLELDLQRQSAFSSYFVISLQVLTTFFFFHI